MPYDLFISYSRRDNTQGRITHLVERIKTDFAPFAKRELVPFFDQQEITGMQDWRQRILQGRLDRVLLVLELENAFALRPAFSSGVNNIRFLSDPERHRTGAGDRSANGVGNLAERIGQRTNST